MRFKFVALKNFLSFGAPYARVELDKQGLTAIFGQNTDSQGADSNGAGKSTICEAIVWCLYGETMRGYKGDEVVNRAFGKECAVVMEIEDEGKEYMIERSRCMSAKKPADLKLFVDNKNVSQGTNADTQAMIQTIIGMDFATFTQSVMLSHGSKPFSQMTDKDQKQVLEDIMQSNLLSVARDKGRARIIEVEQLLDRVRTKLSGLAVDIESTKARLKKLQESRDQHAILMEQRKRELINRRVGLEVRLEEIYEKTGLDIFLAQREDQERQIAELNQELSGIQAQELAITREHGQQRTVLAREEGMVIGRLRHISDDLQAVNRVVGKPCPTCRQVLTPESADSCMTAWGGEAKTLEARLQEFGKERAKIDVSEKKKLKKFSGQRTELDAKNAQIQGILQGTNESIQKRHADLQTICDLEQQIFNLDEEITNLDMSANPYGQLITQLETELAEFTKVLRVHEYQDHALEVKLTHLQYWQHGYGNQGLKSYVLDSVIPYLTARAQYYADILSGGDIKIEFSTQTALKTGQVREQFQVLATNRYGADVYQGNSSGEKRRVDLSVGWALGDLAASRARKPIRFKGLDEPFENLDETGEDSVIRLLHTVVDQYETILCITHSTHLQSQFQNQITVVKQNGVSTIQ